MKQFNRLLITGAIILLAFLIIYHFSFSAQNEIITSSFLSAVELLRESHSKRHLVPHVGTLHIVNIRNGKTNTSTVAIRQKEGKTRMDYKTGRSAGLSIIDDGKQVMRLDGKHKTAVINILPSSPGDISLLISNHDVILEGTATLANHLTQVIKVVPRHKGNPWKKLWIDTETFIPLKKEYYNSDGILTTQTFYTNIRYDVPIRESDFALPKDWRVIQMQKSTQKMPPEQLAKTLGSDIVKPGYVPSGYVLEELYLVSKDDNDGIAHFRYTNGLNSISVLERAPPLPIRLVIRIKRFIGQLKRSIGRSDKMHRVEERIREILGISQGRVIWTTRGKLYIILVGDIAEQELQKMADSIK